MRRAFLPSVLKTAALILAAIGCTGDEAESGGGTVIISSAADADALLPPLRTSVGGRMMSELLFDPLVEVGPELNTFGDAGFASRLAKSWSWSADSLVITFALDPSAHWEDGHAVVGRDVRAGFAAIREPANGSTTLSDVTEIDSVHVVDEHTVSMHFRARSAEQMYTASLVFPLPAHLVDTIPAGALSTSAFAQHPVGSGRYRLVSREPTVRIELAAVAGHYRGRPGPDRVALVVSKEPSTAIAKLWTEEADVFDVLPPPDVAEAAMHPHVQLVRTLGFDYTFVGFNFRDPRDTSRAHPVLADVRLRRAIAQSIDGTSIVRALFDTLARPGAGPFVRAQAAGDTTLVHPAFDATAANAALDALGWTKRGRDGTRMRAGQRLVLRALVPAPSANRVRAAVLVQEQLRGVGIDMHVEKVDGQAFGAARDAGAWDLIFGGWGTTPSIRGIRGTWGGRAHKGWGRLNSGNYASTAFDAALEAGFSSLDTATARGHFRDAFRTITDDVPAIWLYEVMPVSAVNARFTLPRWRPEAWWRTIADWRLDPSRAMPRDARPKAK